MVRIHPGAFITRKVLTALRFWFMAIKLHEIFMAEALKEAQKAFDRDEVPVGCVIVQAGHIIARGHNQVEMLKDPTAHAEMLALDFGVPFAGDLASI